MTAHNTIPSEWADLARKVALAEQLFQSLDWFLDNTNPYGADAVTRREWNKAAVVRHLARPVFMTTKGGQP